MAIHVAVDVVATALAWLLAYVLRFHADAVGRVLPVTKGVPDLSRYLLLLPLMAVLWPVVLYFHGLYQMKRGRSRIDELFAIVLQRPHRLRPHPGSHALRARLLPLPARGRAAVGVQPGGVRDLRRPRRPAAQRGAVGRARPAGAPLGRRRGPDPRGRGRDRRSRAHGRRGPHRPPQARLPRGGLPGRGARRRRARRPSGGRHDRERARGHREEPCRPALRRPAARGPRAPRPPRQEPEQRVRRHQGGPRRRAVRDHQGRARGPRRDPDHQPQRGAAPGLEQHGEAADGRRGLHACSCSASPSSPSCRSSPCSCASSAERARSSSGRSA